MTVQQPKTQAICFKKEFETMRSSCCYSFPLTERTLDHLQRPQVAFHTNSSRLCPTERISNVSITASPSDPLSDGVALNLTCEASGSIFSRQWRKDGAELSVDGNMALHQLDSVLSFRSVNATYEGKYSCAVGNPIGTEEAGYDLRIQRK